jgi:hypothetical protein
MWLVQFNRSPHSHSISVAVELCIECLQENHLTDVSREGCVCHFRTGLTVGFTLIEKTP